MSSQTPLPRQETRLGESAESCSATGTAGAGQRCCGPPCQFHSRACQTFHCPVGFPHSSPLCEQLRCCLLRCIVNQSAAELSMMGAEGAMSQENTDTRCQRQLAMQTGSKCGHVSRQNRARRISALRTALCLSGLLLSACSSWDSHEAGYGDRLGGLNGVGPYFTNPPPWSGSSTPSPMVTVRGSGFDSSINYRCTFRGLGTNTNAVKSSPGSVVSSSLILCVPPAWDTSTTWTAFPDAVESELSVESSSSSSGWQAITTTLSSNGQRFNFSQINKRPSFVGASAIYG